MRLKICMLIFLFVMSGCSIESEETEETDVPPENSEPASIKLTPIDLFDGEAGKFKNFLGSMSGGIKLEYEGSKPNASLDIDIWENGQKVDTAGSIGDLFYSLDEQKRSNEVEIIISIDTVNFDVQTEYSIIKVNKVRGSDSSLSTITLPWNKELTLRGVLQHTEPQSFSVDHPVNVFGMQATRSNQISITNLSEASLAEAEWALVFTLRFDD